MTSAGAIGLEVDHGVRISGLDLQQLPGAHGVEGELCLKDRKGTIQSRGIESDVDEMMVIRVW